LYQKRLINNEIQPIKQSVYKKIITQRHSCYITDKFTMTVELACKPMMQVKLCKATIFTHQFRGPLVATGPMYISVCPNF